MHDLITLALDFPAVFDQLFHDMGLANSVPDEQKGWRRSGETIQGARERLLSEREEAKRRAGA